MISGCPVRRKYTEGNSTLTFPSQEILSEQTHDLNNSEDIVLQEHDDLLMKKVLPDRAKAARNRANARLVEFIVNRRRVEKRLLVHSFFIRKKGRKIDMHVTTWVLLPGIDQWAGIVTVDACPAESPQSG